MGSALVAMPSACAIACREIEFLPYGDVLFDVSVIQDADRDDALRSTAINTQQENWTFTRQGFTPVDSSLVGIVLALNGDYASLSIPGA